jgi:glyoxylase-like metal-dependent hydrolase (beta-lactamase superfamily II)
MREVFFLNGGRFDAPASAVGANWPVWTSAKETLSLTVAVCVRDDGSLLLVDAGWSEAVCDNPARELGRLRARGMGLKLRPTDSIALQLSELGFSRNQVRTIVATHLHLDHVSGVADFPQAELLTTSEELRAYSGLTRDFGYRSRDLAAAERIRVVRLRQSTCLGFPSSLDLLGNGEVTLLGAEGHTPGHLAVALRGPGGLFVHVGDAVYQGWEYELGAGGPCRLARLLNADNQAVERTYARLRACREDASAPRLVPSHDWRVFGTLPHKPAGAGTAG